MATTKAITNAQFDSLIENLSSYYCEGWSRNVRAEKETEWDTLHFKYDGSSSVGAEFLLAHPYSRLAEGIDYNVIEVRFSTKYPWEQENIFRVTDVAQVARLLNAVAEPYRLYREFGTLGARAARIRHEGGEYLTKNANG